MERFRFYMSQIFDIIFNSRVFELETGPSFVTFRIFVDYSASCIREKEQIQLLYLEFRV